MGQEDVQNLLKAGINAAKAGNKALARQFLEKVLEQDDSNEAAWMWFAMIVDTPKEKRICLENVLSLNPDNKRAREALERLEPETRSAPPRSTLPPSAPRMAVPPVTELRSPSGRQPAPALGIEGAPLRRRRRQRFSPPILAAGAAAVLMGLIGLYFIATSSPPAPVLLLPPTDSPATRTAISVITQGAVAVLPPTSTRPPLTPSKTVIPTLTMFATVLEAASTRPTDLPTATPTITDTPAPVLIEPSPTLPPAESYRILFLGENRSGVAKGLFEIKGNGKDERASPLNSILGPVVDFAIAPNGKLALAITKGPAAATSASTVAGPAQTSTAQAKQTVAAVPPKAQLYVADADGKNLKQITQLAGTYLGQPTWSPDGTRVAFVSDDPGNRALFIVNVDGSNLTRLTENRMDVRDPAWSPTGTHIAFSADSTGQGFLQIYTISLQNKEIRQITNSAGNNTSPAWSPDINRFVIVSTRDRFPAIYIINARDGSNPQLLTFNDGGATNRDPQWSPDGRYILFSSNRGGENKTFSLYMISSDTKVLIPVAIAPDPNANAYKGVFLPSAQ